MRTDEPVLGCEADELERAEPPASSTQTLPGTGRSATALTAGMMKLKGFEPPTEIVFPIMMEAQSARTACASRADQAKRRSARSFPMSSWLRCIRRVRGRTLRRTPELEHPMSTAPGPATHGVLSLRSVSKRYGAVQAATRDQRGLLEPARSTRSSGRTGPGSRHYSGSQAGSSRPTRAPSRSASAGLRLPRSPRRFVSASAWPTRPTRRFSRCPSRRTFTSLRHPPHARHIATWRRWAEGKLSEFGLGIQARDAGGEPLPGRAADARGREGAPPAAEGTAPRRADDGARPRGDQMASWARGRTEQDRRRRHVRQPPAPGGARRSPTGSPSCATE